jgi:hypothetical protein
MELTSTKVGFTNMATDENDHKMEPPSQLTIHIYRSLSGPIDNA